MGNYEVGQTVGIKGKVVEIVENEDGLFLKLKVKASGKTFEEIFADDQIVGGGSSDDDTPVDPDTPVNPEP